MGKKKKKEQKPYCWYCTREFDDEKILVQHQKAKHFKCHICHKKLTTAGGMVIHVFQVHKENITKVPNAKPGRDNIGFEIFGMQGIPDEPTEDLESAAKRAKTEPLNPTPMAPVPLTSPTTTAPNPNPAPYYPPVPIPQMGMYGGPLPPGWQAPPSWGMPGLPGMPMPGMHQWGMPPNPYGMPGLPGMPLMQAPSSPTHGQKIVANPQAILVYNEENLSMEEKRADLEKYRYDEEKIKEQVSKLNSNIESRLSSVKIGQITGQY